eukprot:TRINITY_DN10190_c0_g1_i1.p1 TRINITY_DN10190_c0_g1~~TRINITY_DN10190_c0_g1_i1.p1  ORF type:complete len:238 (-),score=20.48 TRINITY_DN10190_c0_g1_i1:19-651(-)
MEEDKKNEPQLVFPGQKIGETTEYDAGKGTFCVLNRIHATLLGFVEITRDGDKKPLIEVRQDKPPSIVPQIGDTVTAKVTKVNTRQAAVEILCVGAEPLKESFPGKVRREDVRAFEVDAVEIYKSFRPGDIIRAQVISLGDSRSYYLSTAKNELGVILANSSAGYAMVPVSWQQMQCPVTNLVEFRKVAKIIDNDTSSSEQLNPNAKRIL